MKVSNNSTQLSHIGNTSNDAAKTEGAGKPEKKGFAFAKDLFDKATSMRFGSVAESICDKIGLPEGVGDIAGIVVSLGTFNYLETTEHIADLGKDIAAKNGNTKLAGFLEGYEQKVGKFNQIAGKLAFLVGSTIATGGAAGVAGAAGASASAVSVGGASVSAAQFFQGVNMVGSAIDAGSAWQNGDKMGAALGALGVLGDVAGLGDVLGLSPSQAEGLKTFADKGQTALGAFAKANEDGKIDLKDLKHVPFGELVSGLDLDDTQKGLLQSAVNVVSSEDQGGALMSLLTSTIIDKAMGEVGKTDASDQQKQVLQQALGFFGESMQTGQTGPAAMNLFAQLLSQLGHAESSARARDLMSGPLKM